MTVEKIKIENSLSFPASSAPAGYIMSIDAEGKIVWIPNN